MADIEFLLMREPLTAGELRGAFARARVPDGPGILVLCCAAMDIGEVQGGNRVPPEHPEGGGIGGYIQAAYGEGHPMPHLEGPSLVAPGVMLERLGRASAGTRS